MFFFFRCFSPLPVLVLTGGISDSPKREKHLFFFALGSLLMADGEKNASGEIGNLTGLGKKVEKSKKRKRKRQASHAPESMFVLSLVSFMVSMGMASPCVFQLPASLTGLDPFINFFVARLLSAP